MGNWQHSHTEARVLQPTCHTYLFESEAIEEHQELQNGKLVTVLNSLDVVSHEQTEKLTQLVEKSTDEPGTGRGSEQCKDMAPNYPLHARFGTAICDESPTIT